MLIPLGTVYCKKCKPNPHSNVEPRIISGAARRSTRGAHDAAHPAVSTDGRRRRTLTVHRDPAVPRPPTAPRRNSELDFQISRLHNPKRPVDAGAVAAGRVGRANTSGLSLWYVVVL